ncbi:MAG: hypothetical protein CSA20_10030 [Deltaproteobacteria bacterium]|nr:MAG: hypothetical protein CSA20_10030 [Deltaproteobacteria bacterium]
MLGMVTNRLQRDGFQLLLKLIDTGKSPNHGGVRQPEHKNPKHQLTQKAIMYQFFNINKGSSLFSFLIFFEQANPRVILKNAYSRKTSIRHHRIDIGFVSLIQLNSLYEILRQ